MCALTYGCVRQPAGSRKIRPRTIQRQYIPASRKWAGGLTVSPAGAKIKAASVSVAAATDLSVTNSRRTGQRPVLLTFFRRRGEAAADGVLGDRAGNDELQQILAAARLAADARHL